MGGPGLLDNDSCSMRPDSWQTETELLSNYRVHENHKEVNSTASALSACSVVEIRAPWTEV